MCRGSHQQHQIYRHIILASRRFSNPIRTTDNRLNRIINTNCCKHTVVPPYDGPRYARNMYRLRKYNKNKLCIELCFLYTTKPSRLKRDYSCNLQQCSVRQITLHHNFIEISCYLSHILYRVFLQHSSIFAIFLSWRIQ